MKKCSICGKSIKDKIFKTRNSYPKLIQPIYEKMIIDQDQEYICKDCLDKIKNAKMSDLDE